MKATTKVQLAAIISITSFSVVAPAQHSSEIRAKQANATVGSNTVLASTTTTCAASQPTEHERMLIDRIEKLERRLLELESRTEAKPTRDPLQLAPACAGDDHSAEDVAKSQDRAASEIQEITTEDRGVLDFLRNTTFNVTIDGYYGYNFNKPVGRINLLRAYDVQSNSFSLNQATILIERAPGSEAGRRFGGRLDLMYGQATETLQGNAANEGRPQAYRPVWQAYGSYVAPVGKGLTLDFGKFASSLGYETNYAKDNYNYSRSYYFNFLPFYHFGLRAKYPVNEKVTLAYHLMNGAQQSEDFNGFKSQHFALILAPVKKLSWQVNYYVGQEQRDLAPALNPGIPISPAQPGLSTSVIRPAPNGRLHIFDTYAAWSATDRLVLAVEGDYVVNRVQDVSAPVRVSGGAGYLRYQLTPKFGLAARAEYLSDGGGLFSGVVQALKETTLTSEFKLGDGFLMRGEWRRDVSNRPFFLTDVQGVLKKQQNTATLGLIWWFGRKEGSW